VTTDDFAALKLELIHDEGISLTLYKDTVGKWTVGVGRNIQDIGISTDEAMLLLENDIAGAVGALNHQLPWFPRLDPMRQRVLINMCFQMGIGKLLGFQTTLEHVRQGHYDEAAGSMLQSKWAQQTPNRAKRLAAMMRTGKA